MKSFAAPDASLREDSELLGDRIETTVTGLLGLLGIEADPLQSREHILISTILQEAWRAGRSLDLPALIQAIQQPPVSRIGVMEVDSFYPANERYGLALKLNNLIASPGFESWLTGEPLDIDRLLYTTKGKPRISVVSIARIEERIRKAQQAVEREEEQSKQQKLQTAISVGATVLGSILGRKTLSRTSLGRATTAARGVGRTMKEAGDITCAKETVAAKQQEFENLDAEFREEIEALEDRFDPMAEEIEVRPLKKDIAVGLVSLAWVPHWEDAQGNRTPAWD